MFGSGLLGGFGHCFGMCGPVVATYSLRLKQRSIMPHLLYNAGRITTYSLLGGIMGLSGSFVGIIKPLEKYQDITLAMVGAVMVMMGLVLSGWLPFSRSKEQGARGKKSDNAVIHCIARVVKFVAGTESAGAYYPMGLVLGFLPCGLLYTALIAAAGAGVEAGSRIGGLLRGMLLLFLFGLGTAPSMFLLGKIVSLKSEWLRNRFYKGSAVIMIVTGILFIHRALRQ